MILGEGVFWFFGGRGGNPAQNNARYPRVRWVVHTEKNNERFAVSIG